MSNHLERLDTVANELDAEVKAAVVAMRPPLVEPVKPQLPKHLMDFNCASTYQWAVRVQHDAARLKSNLSMEEANLRRHRAEVADVEELLEKTKRVAGRICNEAADNRVELITNELNDLTRRAEIQQRLVNTLRTQLETFLDSGTPKNSDTLLLLAEFEECEREMKSL
jgi:hypothetical protein